jgi:Zn-dependent protease
MLFAEPPRSGADVEFSLAGIPVRVHPMFWLFTAIPVISQQPFDAVYAGIWVGVVFLSILVHELGHALTARWFGAHPRIILYGFGGLATYRPQEFRPGADPTWRSILISFAGPAAGFLLAIVTMAVLQATGFQVQVDGLSVRVDPSLINIHHHLYEAVAVLLFVNIVWGILNLVPVYPLDGGQILHALLARMTGITGIKQTFITGVMLGGLIAFYAAYQMQNAFLTALFGYLAFQNYQLLESIKHLRW